MGTPRLTYKQLCRGPGPSISPDNPLLRIVVPRYYRDPPIEEDVRAAIEKSSHKQRAQLTIKQKLDIIAQERRRGHEKESHIRKQQRQEKDRTWTRREEEHKLL